MGKKWIVFMLICLLAMMLIINTTCKKEETIKIGLLMDLSGRSSSIGTVGRNSVQLVFDAYNQQPKKNPKRVQLILKDCKGDPSLTNSLLDELEMEGVQVVIGPLTSNIAEAVMESKAYKEDRMLFISPTVSSSVFFGKEDNFITFIDANEAEGQFLAEQALKDGKSKIAIVYEEANKVYTLPVVSTFEKYFKEGGGEVLCKCHFTSSDSAPFEQIAKEIFSGSPDGVLISANDVDAASLCQYLHMLSPELDIYSGLWAKTNEFIQNGSKSVEGTLMIATYDEESTEVMAFIKRYSEAFGSTPSFSGAQSYDVAEILAQAIEEGTAFNSKSIKDYILEKNTFSSLSGTIHIDQYGDCDRPYIIVKVSEGNYKKVAP